jgi:hypothetical protein
MTLKLKVENNRGKKATTHLARNGIVDKIVKNYGNLMF